MSPITVVHIEAAMQSASEIMNSSFQIKPYVSHNRKYSSICLDNVSNTHVSAKHEYHKKPKGKVSSENAIMIVAIHNTRTEIHSAVRSGINI